MRISDLRREDRGRATTVSAWITWEDCDRAPEELRFDAEGVEPSEIVASPEAFVIRAALAALRWNEVRVLVEGSLCPRLRDGLRAALRTLRQWRREVDRPEPAIEASRGFRALSPSAPRAALFLSGGADSLLVLRSNRLNFPPSHPGSMRTAIFVPNFGARLEAVSSPRASSFLFRQKDAVARIASLTGLRLISAWASAGELGEDEDFFERCSHSAHLAAVAHLFSPILDSVAIAPSFDIARLVPWGGHPLLDLNYASSAIEIRQPGIQLSREERIAEISRWDEVLPSLIVCSQGPLELGQLNCGRCEKCVRTMIAIFLAGALPRATSFPVREIDVSHIARLSLRSEVIVFWAPFPEPLRRRGRGDLASAVENLVARGRREASWFEDRGWKGGLRRFDRTYLGGRLLNARRRFRAASVRHSR